MAEIYRIQDPLELKEVRPLDYNVYRFPQKEKGCKNVIWAVLFFILFGLYVAGGCYGIYDTVHAVQGNKLTLSKEANLEEAHVVSDTDVNIGTPDDFPKNDAYRKFPKALGVGMSAALLACMIYTVVTLFLLKLCAGAVIRCSLITFIIVWVLAIVGVHPSLTLAGIKFTWYLGGGIGVLGFVFLCITLLYWYLGWDHIPFAEASLKIAIQVFNQNPSIVFIPIIFSVLSVISLGFFGFSLRTLYVLLKYMGYNYVNNSYNVVYYTCYCFTVFVYFWISLVWINMVHVTCCAYIAGFLLGGDYKLSVCESFGVAWRNIGAISLGSGILALIKTLRMVAEDAMNDDNNNGGAERIIFIILYCFLVCLESIFEYVSEYAYVFVALYEKDFLSAAEDSWNLFKYRGFDMIINDDFSNMPGYIFTIIGSMLSGYVATFVTMYMMKEKDSTELKEYTYILIPFVLGLFLGSTIGNIIYGILASYIKTTFVVFAQHPEVLAFNQPHAYITLNNSIWDRIQSNPERYQKHQL